MADRWLSVGAQYAFSLLLLPMVLAARSWSIWLTSARALVYGVIFMELLAFGILNYYGWSYEQIRGRFGPDFFTGVGRVSGFLGGANLHAAFLCMCLPFVYYLRIVGMMSLPVFLLALGLIGAGVFYSASATGFGALVIVSLTFVVLSRVRISPRFVGIAAAAAAAFVLAGAPMPKAFEKRVAGALESGQIEEAGTFAGRLELIEESWKFANQSLMLGIGVDQYRQESFHKMPVHNLYLLLWVEGGIFTLIGWLGLIGLLGYTGLVMIARRPLDAALALSVLVVLIIFSIAAPHMYARVWIAPALLAVMPAFAIGRPPTRSS
ncbi:MAG: O-antigen ligase family protein [Parvularculaceae bacterium]|nr:O-antigen ligase family protein [Parvularculaceae bacterium]